MALRTLRILTPIVIAMVILDALTTPLAFASAWLFPGFYTAAITPVATDIDMLIVIFGIATMIVFAAWIVQAGRNLVEFGYDDLEFTPAARVWWFAVPLACLVVPYQGMRELWNASHGRRDYTQTEPLVAIWWSLWLLRSFSGLITLVFVSVEGNIGFWVQGTVDAALALVAIQLLREVTAAQGRLRGPGLAAWTGAGPGLRLNPLARTPKAKAPAPRGARA